MYKSGYSLRFYQILENDLINFLNYFSLEYYSSEEWKKIYSPRLAELLIRIGSQVDIFFKNWNIVHQNNPTKRPEELKFQNYKSINRIYNLDDKQIKILITNDTLKPFEDWTKTDPNWWLFHNNVKHDGFYHKEEGNLFNVIESLAALFLLNCVHEDTQIKLIEYGYRKVDPNIYDIIIRKGKYFEPPNDYITTQLFEFKK